MASVEPTSISAKNLADARELADNINRLGPTSDEKAFDECKKKINDIIERLSKGSAQREIGNELSMIRNKIQEIRVNNNNSSLLTDILIEAYEIIGVYKRIFESEESQVKHGAAAVQQANPGAAAAASAGSGVGQRIYPGAAAAAAGAAAAAAAAAAQKLPVESAAVHERFHSIEDPDAAANFEQDQRNAYGVGLPYQEQSPFVSFADEVNPFMAGQPNRDSELFASAAPEQMVGSDDVNPFMPDQHKYDAELFVETQSKAAVAGQIDDQFIEAVKPKYHGLEVGAAAAAVGAGAIAAREKIYKAGDLPQCVSDIYWRNPDQANEFERAPKVTMEGMIFGYEVVDKGLAENAAVDENTQWDRPTRKAVPADSIWKSQAETLVFNGCTFTHQGLKSVPNHFPKAKRYEFNDCVFHPDFFKEFIETNRELLQNKDITIKFKGAKIGEQDLILSAEQMKLFSSLNIRLE